MPGARLQGAASPPGSVCAACSVGTCCLPPFHPAYTAHEVDASRRLVAREQEPRGKEQAASEALAEFSESVTFALEQVI